MWIRFATASIAAAALSLGAAWAAAADSHAAPAAKAEAETHGGPAADGKAAGHGGAGAAVNPLEFKTDLALFTAVVFVVLLLVLWKAAWKPIVRALDLREKQVHDEIAAAEKANAEARELLAQHQARLAAAEGEVREILDRGRKETEQVTRDMLDKARAEVEADKQRQIREIEAATAGAMKELADRSATLAVELAGKILQQKLDPAAHAEIIHQAVDRFGKVNGGAR